MAGNEYGTGSELEDGGEGNLNDVGWNVVTRKGKRKKSREQSCSTDSDHGRPNQQVQKMRKEYRVVVKSELPGS